MVSFALDDAGHKADYFYVWMAAVCALIAFGAFVPTYWLQLSAGTFVGPPLLHIHGALFFAWTLLLLSQTAFVANDRLSSHRAWGLGGISLATAMVAVGIAAAIHSLTTGLAAGYGDASRAFFVVPLSGIALFAGFFVTAVSNLRRGDVHKRYMMLATIALLQAPMGRIFFVLITGGGPGLRPGLGPPPSVFLTLAPSLIVEFLIVAGAIHDWRTRGRPHSAWWIGGVVMTVVILLRGPLAGTRAWQAVADAMAHIAS